MDAYPNLLDVVANTPLWVWILAGVSWGLGDLICKELVDWASRLFERDKR